MNGPKDILLFLTLFAHCLMGQEILMYQSFDNKISTFDYLAGKGKVNSAEKIQLRKPAIRGNALWFDQSHPEGKLRIDLAPLQDAEDWTIALWNLIQVKEWLSAPTNNLITLLDEKERPIIKLSKSGGVFVFEDEKVIHMECFDALYWVRGSKEHLALTWESHGSGISSQKGMLRAYWKARPYAALAMELKRRPVSMEIGEESAGLGVDDLYVFNSSLSLRSIWELMRFRGNDPRLLQERLANLEKLEEQRPTANRMANWARLTQKGILIEAEAIPEGNDVIVSPAQKADRNNLYVASNNPASVASGRSCVEPGDKTLSFRFTIDQTNEYALALRYLLERRMHQFWPQSSSAATPWSENYCEVKVRLNGTPLGKSEKLYPTGTYSGHTGDVEPWAWHTLNGGQKLRLRKGEHNLSVTFSKGLAKPKYDALLLSQEIGPKPQHPRWVDSYRIPPAWWVAARKTTNAGGKRIDSYEVTLRNRCDEPCSYEIVVDNERVQPQEVRSSVKHIAFKPFEEKSFEVIFESDSDLENHSGWVNVYLWNDDVSLRQKYRLWNLIPAKKPQSRSRVSLLPKPNLKMQAALSAWLKKRKLEEFTEDLKDWTKARNLVLSEHGQPVRGFPAALSGKRLEALDLWMKMGEKEIEQFLPDGPAEHNGYGTGWERMGIEYSGLWHKTPRVKSIHPNGDVDFVTSLSVEGPPQKGKAEPYKKIYVIGKDDDLISSMRDTRWKSMMGHGLSGAAPYRDSPLGREKYSGITLPAEAYYLTGDEAYAKKAFQMIRIFARKYTGLTKHFQFALNREDRDWWGGRIGGRYLMKFGPRYYHAMGVYVLDLIWDALTPEERLIIEHNVIRWGVYEGMSGPLFEEPAFFAAVNKEDMPYLPMGKLLGDPAPVQGLQFFYDVFKDIVLADGLHQCSLGSYGGVAGYISFLQKLNGYGLDVSKNLALRNSFLAQPSFIFSGGGFPNIDDGGGVNLTGLGAGFGCPSKKQYSWAKEIFKDDKYDLWPSLIAAAKSVNNGPAEKKAERMRKEYQRDPAILEKLWPNLYIAPVKGLAILRNRKAKEPIDWKEVIFDYGLYGGRSHGHPAKLATIPSFNGQIVSMEYGYGKLGELMSLYQSSYAHNVVVVDGRNQFGSGAAVPVGKLCGSYGGEDIQWIDADSSRIYKGVEMRRTVFTTDFGIVDFHLCRSEKSRQYDWMYHSFGEASFKGPKPKKLESLAKSGPLRFARNPRIRKTDDQVQVIWANAPLTKPPLKQSTAILHEKAYVRLWGLPNKATEVTLFGIPMVENVGGEIDYLMLRRHAKATVFATIQEPWRDSTSAMVEKAIRLPVKVGGKKVSENEAYAMEVTLKNADRRVFFVNYSKGSKEIGKVTTNAKVATWRLGTANAVEKQTYTKGSSFAVK